MSFSPKITSYKTVGNFGSPNSPSMKNVKSLPLIHNYSAKGLKEFSFSNEFPVDDIELLYNAKCKDLNICTSKDHREKFLNNFFSSVKGRVLNLQGTGLGKYSAEILAKIIKLGKNYSHLILSNNSLGDEGCEKVAKALKSNLNFIHVDLSGNNLTTEGSAKVFEKFFSNFGMISLDVSSIDRMNKNRVGIKGCQILSNLLYKTSTLSFLNLSGTGIGKEGLDYLSIGISFNTTLLSLNLSYNSLEGKSFHIFCCNLAKSQIKELFLIGNPIGIKGCDSLSGLLTCKFHSTCPLTKLDLSKTEITEESSQKIFFALENNSTLSDLNLSHNLIGPNSCESLSKALSQNSSLKTLNLSSCGLKEEGAQKLSEGLTRNLSLKSLNLSNNYLCDAGAKYLSEGLKKNSGLENLDLSSNLIKNSGGQMIIEALFQNSRINSVNFNNNSLKNEIGHELLALVSRCKHFLKLTLEFNSINLKYVNLIKQCLARNSQKIKDLMSPKIKNDIERLIISENYIDGVFRQITMTEKMKEDVHRKFFKQRTKFFNVKNEEIEKFEEVKEEKNKVLTRKQTLAHEADVSYYDISKTKFIKEKEIRNLKDQISNLAKHLIYLKNKSNSQIESSIFEIVSQKRSKFHSILSDLNSVLQKHEQERNKSRANLEKMKISYKCICEELIYLKSPYQNSDRMSFDQESGSAILPSVKTYTLQSPRLRKLKKKLKKSAN